MTGISALPTAKIPKFIYGTAWKEELTAELTELALRRGFRAIDTANQRRHYFEEGVGRGLAAAYREGIITRADVFLQTKFTLQPDQDERLPYDPAASLSEQVTQSMAKSLEHLSTEFVDSYVFHAPSSMDGWTPQDSEIWAAMERERSAGRARLLGVSNVTLKHLEEMPGRPEFVQNRCFARTGWDRGVRAFCNQRAIVYQGFSLLTANRGVLQHPDVASIATAYGATRPQLVFAFARAVGIVPLTGTTNAKHMQQDLASEEIGLPLDVIEKIETLIA